MPVTDIRLRNRPLVMTAFYVQIIKVWVITFIFHPRSPKPQKNGFRDGKRIISAVRAMLLIYNVLSRYQLERIRYD